MQASAVDSAVSVVVDEYPDAVRQKILHLREMIFRIANEHDDIGEVIEMLKWGMPSYLTQRPKSGTTVRLWWSEKSPNHYGVSVHCQTTLIDSFKNINPQLEYDGNRSIILSVEQAIPELELSHFIYLALTYHSRKKNNIGV